MERLTKDDLIAIIQACRGSNFGVIHMVEYVEKYLARSEDITRPNNKSCAWTNYCIFDGGRVETRGCFDYYDEARKAREVLEKAISIDKVITGIVEL